MKFTQRFPALASRDFLIFWLGHFLSLIGSWMQSTTLPYLAYRISGRPLDLGLIGFSVTLPTLLLALPGGVLIERIDKRKAVIILQVVMMVHAFMLAFLAIAGLIQVWHIVILSFILGSASALEITARQAMLVELVGKQALPNAIALQATSFNLARVLGPSLTAVVLLLVRNNGEGWAFFINGVSFIFIIIGLLFVRTPFRQAASPSPVGKTSWVTEFKQGLHFIRGNPLVQGIILVAAMVGFFGFPFIQQIPALARDVLAVAGDTESLVQIRTSSLYMAQGIGALLAALLISGFSNFRRKGLLLTVSQFTFAIILGVLSLVHELAYALPLIAILGWALVSQMATMNTLIQLDVPNELRGRVFSIYLWAIQGIGPFGSLFIGWLAQEYGVLRAASVASVICLLVLVVIHIRFPAIRQKNI